MSPASWIRIAAITFGAMLIASAPSDASPARFWFSLSPLEPYKYSLYQPPSTSPQSARLDIPVGQDATVYLWAQPQTEDVMLPYQDVNGNGVDDNLNDNLFRHLLDLSLDLTTSETSVGTNFPNASFSAATARNVRLYDPAPNAPPPGDRFYRVVDSADPLPNVTIDNGGTPQVVSLPHLTSNGFIGLMGYAGVSIEAPVPATRGIGPVCGEGVCVSRGGAPVWLMGELTLRGIESGKYSDFWLQVGQAGMVHEGELELVDHDNDPETPKESLFSPSTNVAFGAETNSNYYYFASDLEERQDTKSGDTLDLRIYTTAGLVGDYNSNGKVDAADYTFWRDRLGTSTLNNRDPTVSGVVGNADYNAWKANFGRTTSSGAASSVAVPEPSTGWLIVGAVVVCALKLCPRRPVLAGTGFIVLLIGVSIGRADNIFWDGSHTASFADERNWTNQDGPNRVPTISDNVRFVLSGTTQLDINLNGNFFVNALRFQDASSAINIFDGSGGPRFIQVGAAGISLLPSFTGNKVTISPEIVMAGSQTWDVPDGKSLHVTRQINMNGNNLGLSGTGVSVLSGSIIGGGAIVFNGGQLRIGSSGLSSTSGLAMGSAGSIDTDGSNASFTGALTGSQSLTKTGNGTLSLLGNPALYTGTVHNQQGTLQTYGTSIPNSVVNNGVNLSIIGGGWYGGTITGGGLVSKYADGDLVIAGGANNFPRFNVYGGRIAGNTSSIRNAGDYLHVAFDDSVPGSPARGLALGQEGAGTFGGYMTGPGSFYKEAGGDITLVHDNAHTGGTFLQGGRLNINSSSQLGNGAVYFQGGGLKARGSFDIDRQLHISSYGVLDTNGYNVSVSGQFFGGATVSKVGWGTLVLQNTNNSNVSWDVQAGVLQGTTATIKGPLSISNIGQVNFHQSPVGDFNNAISGQGSVSVTGGGRVNLNVASPQWSGGLSVVSSTIGAGPASLGTGPVSLTWGTVAASGVGSIGNSLNLVTNSNISVNAASDLYWAGPISGSGQLSKLDGGVLRLNGNNSSFSGGVALNSGHLTANPASLGSGPLSLVGGVFYPGATRNTGAYTFTNSIVIYPGGGLIDDFDNTGTLAGVVSGAGALSKIGSGNLVLSGANVHSGGTIVNSGTLTVASATFDGASGSGPLIVHSGARLQYGNHHQVKDGVTATVNGGTIDFATYSDAFDGLVLNNGVVSGGSGSAVSIATGGITSTGSSAIHTERYGLFGGNHVTVTSGTLSMSSTVVDTPNWSTLIKNGVGTLSLTGGRVNLHTGGTVVNSGTLVLDRVTDGATQAANNYGVAVGNLTINAGATVRVNQYHQIKDNASVLINGGTLEIVSPAIDGVRELTLSNATVTGAGGLGIRPGGRIIALGTSVIGPRVIPQLTDNNFQIDVASGGQLSLTSGIEGSTPSQVLTKKGAGNLILNGTAWHAGTIVEEGRFTVNTVLGSQHTSNIVVTSGGTLGGTGVIGGSVSGAGRVAPGNSPGILTINGNYTQSADSTLEIEVASYSGPPAWVPGTDHDKLVVGGTANLGGRLEVKVIDPIKSAGGPGLGLPPINFLTAGSVVGEFADITSPGLESINPNLTVEIDYLPGGATIEFVGKKFNLEFNDTSPPAIPTWQDLPSWRDDSQPGGVANEYPTNLHDLEVLNDSNIERTVSVVTQQERVARLFLGDGDENVNLVVGDGNGGNGMERLTSVTSVNVRENGTLALNNGALGGVAVNVSGGRFEGSGDIDLVTAGETISSERTVTVTSGTFAPGMDSPGMKVGYLGIEGNYKQEAGGTLAIDITGAGGGSNQDYVEVAGTMALDGKLSIDASNVSLAVGSSYTIASAAGGVSGAFDRIEVSGQSEVHFVVSVEAGSGVGSLGGSASSVIPPTLVKVTPYDLGDVDGLPGVGNGDAMAFATVLSHGVGGLSRIPCGQDCEVGSSTDLLSAFNFVDPIPGQQMVDFFDVPYFARQMSRKGGMSISEAYDQIAYAMELVERIPEPGSATLWLITAAAIAGVRRRDRTRGLHS